MKVEQRDLGLCGFGQLQCEIDSDTRCSGAPLRTAVTNIAGKNRVFTLLNRANRAGGLPTATIVQALGAKPDMMIPDLGKGMTQAVNLGIPALQHVSKLRRHLAPIVREIAGVGAERKGWLRRLLGR